MTSAPFIETILFGLFEPDFEAEGRQLSRIGEPSEGMLSPAPPIRIHDARHLQSEARAHGSFSEAQFSEAQFFEGHGFVLLDHESAVEDWEVDPAAPDPACDAVRIYMPEVEVLIRNRLLPGRSLELYQAPLLRRGPGTANPFYGAGVHQDYGLTPDDYQESLDAFTTEEIARGWRSRYEQDDVEGFMVINFWRPVYQEGPLRHMPLGVCEPRSVRVEDCIPIGLVDFTPTGKPTNQLALRHGPGQTWHYYPGMTANEVLAFKNFQCAKSDRELTVQSCFHSAFEEPGAPPGIDERQSCEHRVSVFLLKA